MKKTILVLITFVLVLTVAGCGFWHAHPRIHGFF